MSNQATFDNSIPRRLQYSLAKSVLENYAQSSRYVYRNFSGPQAKDLSGHFCRAKIEEEMAGIAALFRRDVRLQVQTYENNTGCYNEIACGLVKLTQSRVVGINDVPRLAKFRKTLAENGQYEMFVSADDSEEDAYLYAILTHAVDPNSERRSWPAFIKIQFPNKTCTEYVDEGIDLLSRFPELRAEYIPTAEQLRQIKLRRVRRKKERGA